MSARLQVAPVRSLPDPKTTALEIIAADLDYAPGRDAVRDLCGTEVLAELVGRRKRWVAVLIGCAGRVVLPFDTEQDFLEVGANALQLAPYLSGPTVIIPVVGPATRTKLLAAARTRELEMSPAEGRA